MSKYQMSAVQATKQLFEELRVEWSKPQNCSSFLTERRLILKRVVRPYWKFLPSALKEFIEKAIYLGSRNQIRIAYSKTDRYEEIKLKWIKALNHFGCPGCGALMSKRIPRTMCSIFKPRPGCCSRVCAANFEERRDKIKSTSLEKYGYAHPMKSPEVRDILKEAFLLKLGVDNPSKSKQVLSKRRKTCVRLYGVPCSFQAEAVKRKIRRTTRRKYGVDNVMQHPELFSRNKMSRNRVKSGTVAGKRFTYLQGYEPHAIAYLVYTCGVDVSLIQAEAKRIGCFRYVDNDGRVRIYHPDLFIDQGRGTYVEVKSTWTARDSCKPTIKRKLQAVFNAGFDVRLIIMDGKFEALLDKSWAHAN